MNQSNSRSVNPRGGACLSIREAARFLLPTFLLVAWILSATAQTTNIAPHQNYPRAATPLVPHVFLPLPPGAVEPAGWLRDWALTARHGITGHLDEWHPTFANAWKGRPIPGAPGVEADGAGWPLEQSSYWLDGALRLGYLLHDELLIQKATARLEGVVHEVNRGAPSFLYWRKDKPQGFNSWAHSQLGRALVAWYQATGQKQILEALVRVYADYPTNMGPLQFTDVSGLCNVDAMLETYALSGDRRVLERVKAAMASEPAASTISNWAQGRFTEGHTVIVYEDIRLPALLYPWTQDRHVLDASLKAFAWIGQEHLLPYGVASGEEYLSGMGAFRKTETCDVAAQLWSTLWLYRILGQARYGDEIEKSFFNAGAAPIARDFETMCYYQSPNRLRSDSLPCEQPACPGPGAIRFSSLGCSNVLCCVGAVSRIIPSYVTHLWMATPDQGLAAVLYGPCAVSAVAGPGVRVKLSCQTDYPFEEKIRIKVEPEKPAAFPLSFRIPGWCSSPRILVNGGTADLWSAQTGFIRIDREWKKGDRIELYFPMRVQTVRGFETEFPASVKGYFAFEPPAVFEPRRLPYESLTLGPLLFALPIPDQDPNTPATDGRWSCALDNDSALAGSDIGVERGSMPPHWNWPLNAPVVLRVPARTIEWLPTDAQALPNRAVEGGGPETVRLVPYGCTRFRISMFPVTMKALGKPPE
jgi:hypothetical protein